MVKYIGMINFEKGDRCCACKEKKSFSAEGGNVYIRGDSFRLNGVSSRSPFSFLRDNNDNFGRYDRE